MVVSIAFYSAVTLLSLGIVNGVSKVLELNKQIKGLKELEMELDKSIKNGGIY